MSQTISHGARLFSCSRQQKLLASAREEGGQWWPSRDCPVERRAECFKPWSRSEVRKLFSHFSFEAVRKSCHGISPKSSVLAPISMMASP